MAILSQGSFLGELTQRLYRALQLDGVVSCKVDDTVQPVVIVGDGTAPGMGSLRGRRFKGTALGAGAAASAAFFQAIEDVIIDRITVSVGSNAGADAALLALFVNQIGGAVRFAPFMDRTLNVTDLAPVTNTGGGGTAVAGFTSAGDIFSIDLLGGAGISVPFAEALTAPFFLQAGNGIFLRTGTVRALKLNFEGRTFG